jgi:hypothetical protein
MRQIEAAQVPTKRSQQGQQVRWSKALRIVRPFALPSEQREQVLLHFASPRVHIAQACQDRGHEEPLLCLPHVVLGCGLAEPMLDEAREPLLFDLAGRLLNEQPRHILQQHRLQRQAARQLTPLAERAAAQTIHGFEHLPCRRRRDEKRQ